MPAASDGPVVFISYSHDSDEHRDRVLSLSERLRKDGYATRLDRYVDGQDHKPWPLWMLDQIDEADFVLCVCTETYYRRFRGNGAPGEGRGVAWEGAIISQQIYDDKSQTSRFVSVTFEPAPESIIPEPLRGKTHYTLDSNESYNALRDFLDGAAGVEPRPVGRYQPRERRLGTPLTFPEKAHTRAVDSSFSEVQARRASECVLDSGTHSLARRACHGKTLNNLPFVSLQGLFVGRQEQVAELRRRLVGQGTSACRDPIHGVEPSPRLDESSHYERSHPGSAVAVVTRQAIHGLGGIGKTRLAIEYAWRFEAEYSALLFVTADSPERLQANLAALAGRLGLPEAQATEQAVQVEAVLSWFEEHSDWLLIVDNVDSPESAAAVELLLPRWRAGHLLITSRLSNWSASVQQLELHVLDEDSAKEFLLVRTGSPRESEDDAKRLAAELGCLALALEQAAAYTRRMRITLAEYHQQWRDHVASVQAWHNPQLMQYPASLATTWQTTLDQLTPNAVGLLRVLAWFAPEPIPIGLLFKPEMLRRGSRQSSLFLRACRSLIAFVMTLFQQHSASCEDAVCEWLAELADFSMVTLDAETQTMKVHRVVQEILRTRQPEPIACLTTTLRLLNAARPEGNSGDVRTWPAWAPLAAHVAFATEQADQRHIDEPTSALMGALGTLLSAKALHKQAERLKRRALAIDEHSFGPEHPNVARDLNNLATLLQATNRLSEAEPLMRRALAIDEHSFGPEHPNVAIDLNNLAQLLKATNRLSEAEPLMRRALAIDEHSFGPEHPDVAIDLNNLAQLLQATNRLSEAEPLMRRALAIDQHSFGPEHPDVAFDLNNLARLLQATNRLSEAEPLMRRALDIFVNSLGDDHPNSQIVAGNYRLLHNAMRG